jgi:hypothetical protein
MTYINRQDVVDEVAELFERYEKALVTNDIQTLDALFWTSDQTIRLGATENLFGHEEILEFRKKRPGTGLERTVNRVEITTFGESFATANAIFTRTGWVPSRSGRQSQTLVKFPGVGWQIVSAHVSIVDLAD